MKPPPDFLFFSDLDGTLLDSDTYEATGAVEALACLKQSGIPLIFCSSKTFEEQRFYQQKFDIHAPFIVENGSAVCIPEGYFPGLSVKPDFTREGFDFFLIAHADAAFVQSTLRLISLETGLDIEGYADVDDEEIIRATGLAPEKVAAARKRLFTETLLKPGITAPETIVSALNLYLGEHGLALVRGGRFFSVQSARADKGRAVQWLSDLYHQVFGARIFTVAAGDSNNDLTMLAAADKAFLIVKPSGKWEDIDLPDVLRIALAGSLGFDYAVKSVFSNKEWQKE